MKAIKTMRAATETKLAGDDHNTVFEVVKIRIANVEKWEYTDIIIIGVLAYSIHFLNIQAYYPRLIVMIFGLIVPFVGIMRINSYNKWVNDIVNDFENEAKFARIYLESGTKKIFYLFIAVSIFSLIVIDYLWPAFLDEILLNSHSATSNKKTGQG